jgi:hypothetical protein
MGILAKTISTQQRDNKFYLRMTLILIYYLIFLFNAINFFFFKTCFKE